MPVKTSTPSPDKLVRIISALGVLLSVAAFLVVRQGHDAWFYDLWGDRDLMRAREVATAWPTHGAELSFASGTRIPGGAQALLQAAALAIDPDPRTAMLLQYLLEALGALILSGYALRRAGAWAAVVALGAWYSSNVTYEVVRNLWNPGLVPFFAAVATVSALVWVAERRPWAVVPFAAATAIGAQLHLTVPLVALLLAPGLVAARPPLRRAPLAVALACVVVIYGPFLLFEAGSGWPTLDALLHLQLHTVRPDSWTLRWSDLAAAWRTDGTPEPLLINLDLGTGYAFAQELASVVQRAVHVAVLCIAPVVAWRAGPGPTRTLLVMLSTAWWLLLCYLALPHQVQLSVFMGSRYLIAAWPALVLVEALLAGLALQALLATNRRLVATALVVAVSAMHATQLDVRLRGLGLRVFDPRTWVVTNRLLEDVSAATGWTRREVTGRTIFAEHLNAEQWTWNTLRGVDYLLALDGEAFPGSLAPPCAVVLGASQRRYADAPPTADDLAHVLGPSAGPARVLAVHPIRDAALLVTYEIPGERCRTSFVNRYVDTDVEALLRPATRGLTEGSVIELAPPAPDTRRAAWVAHLHFMRHAHHPRLAIRAALDVRALPGAVGFTLHSSQLRGMSYNEGWFHGAAVRDPFVRLTRDDGTSMEVSLAKGWVGIRNQVTPLVVEPVEVPPGTWRVDLHWLAAVDTSALDRPGDVELSPMGIALFHDLVVPPPP